MRRRTTAIGLTAAALAVGLAACEGSNMASGTARLSVRLTDAPAANITEAVVTISRVYLQGTPEEGADPSADMVLMSSPVTTNLLSLSNDVISLVDGHPVKAGTYGQMRFVVDGGYIVVDEGGSTKVYATPGYDVPPELTVDGELKCPSCSQSGIKVNFPDGALTLTEDKVILVDFDVADTFGHQAGKSGKWVMHPSLKATDVRFAGTVHVLASVADTVELPDLDGNPTTLEAFSAELRSADLDPGTLGEQLSFTGPDADGNYEATFMSVVPGDYDANVLSPMDGGNPLIDFTTDPSMPQSITVDSDGDVTVHFEITSATLHAGG